VSSIVGTDLRRLRDSDPVPYGEGGTRVLGLSGKNRREEEGRVRSSGNPNVG